MASMIFALPALRPGVSTTAEEATDEARTGVPRIRPGGAVSAVPTKSINTCQDDSIFCRTALTLGLWLRREHVRSSNTVDTRCHARSLVTTGYPIIAVTGVRAPAGGRMMHGLSTETPCAGDSRRGHTTVLTARDSRVDVSVILGRSHGCLQLGLRLLFLFLVSLKLLPELLLRRIRLCLRLVWFLLLLLMARRATARANSRLLRGTRRRAASPTS